MALFRKLIEIFEAPQLEAPLHSADEVALAALMVRLARADDRFDDEERAVIERLLDARFGDGAALLAAGEAAEARALDHQQFTSAIKSVYAFEDRGRLLEDLWEVVLADGEREMHEDALMRQIASLLHVPDREVAEARRRVERR